MTDGKNSDIPSKPEYVRLHVDQVLSLEPEQAYLMGLIDVHQLKKMLDKREEKL